MQSEILKNLKLLETTHELSILYACESGSRAWGFPSPDSDYDVRFLYVKSLPYHLSLGQKKDTLELMLPGDLDLSGWELAKALALFAKSNIALFEWLQSPLVYYQNPRFHQQLLGLIPTHFNAIRGAYHYRSMAKSALGSWVPGGQISVKKALYAMRALACGLWIRNYGTMPPTDFHRILGDTSLIPPSLQQEIASLIAQKQNLQEARKVILTDCLTSWIQAQRSMEADPVLHNQSEPDFTCLNQMLHDWVVHPN